MELSREEYEVLWKVEHSWEHNPEQASDDSIESIRKFNKIFLELEDKHLLNIHIKNNRIDSAMVTHHGIEVLREPKYHEWYDELKEVTH